MEDRVDKTKEEWKNELTPEQFHVCRQKGTEPAFFGRLLGYEDTRYLCLRLLRPGALRLEYEVRLGNGLAQLLGADR